MRPIIIFLVIGLLEPKSYSAKGIDFSSLCNNYFCMKGSYSFAILRAWCSYGAADSNVPQNIKNAKSFGFQYVDVYMFPCRQKDVKQQVNALIDYLTDHLYGNGTLQPEPMTEGQINAKGLSTGFYESDKEDLQPYNNSIFLQDILINGNNQEWRNTQYLNHQTCFIEQPQAAIKRQESVNSIFIQLLSNNTPLQDTVI